MKKDCLVKECKEKHYSKGYCKCHFDQISAFGCIDDKYSTISANGGHVIEQSVSCMDI